MKNHFDKPKHTERVILDENDKVVGTIRIKPSTIMWKPVNQHVFDAVDLDTFVKWITNPSVSGSTKRKS